MARTLWAVSDLHVTFAENRAMVDSLRPQAPGDWLIVAGDVAERTPEITATLATLVDRFAKVVWVPGNHELFSRADAPARGKAKYRALVGALRALGVVTPEDPFPRFGPYTVCPLFTLYDYSFRPLGLSATQAVARARVRLDDELLIAPYVNIQQWCAERIEYSEARLAAVNGPTILVNHWPLVEEPTARLHEPDIALWCGTRATQQWPVKYHAHAVIHGHLHIPATTTVDGVTHVDASLGYPFERQRWGAVPPRARAMTQPSWPYPVASVHV